MGIKASSNNLFIGGGFCLGVDAVEERAGLGQEDLGFTVVEINWHLSSLDHDTVASEEDVADRLSLTEASVRNVDMDLAIDVISQGNEERSTSVGVESVVSPFLGEGVVEDALRLAGTVDSLDELEDIVVLVEVSPHDLSVEGIVASSETLLAAVVKEGDASSC